MHISESPEYQKNILTKCAKMNEDSHKRLVVNGNSEGTVLKGKDENPKNTFIPSTPGGRLKFFKDGKFILELERAKEGERVSWVSVPRKTFWPPQGVATSVTYKQESSTSLSISDDNSSIQSSPWQRDHFWKQTTPHKNISTEMSFYFWRPKIIRKSSIFKNSSEIDSSKTANNNAKIDVCNRLRKRGKQKPILSIVQNLIDKYIPKTPPRTETVVSPRKRFLRDLEKDKIGPDDNSQKRLRNKTGTQASTSGGASPLCMNGHTEEKPHVPVAAPVKNCSYSITSLLSDDRASSRRSPSNSPCQFMPVPSQKNINSAAMKSEDLWYSESVERFRSIELSQTEKGSLPPYQPHSSYISHYMYPYSFPACYPYNRGLPPIPPPMYHHLQAHHLPMPMIRPDTPSCSWKTDKVDNESYSHKEDSNVSDMPLNLSKH